VLAFSRDRQDHPITGTGYSDAELRHLVRHEHARSHADLLQRRTSLAITGAMSDAVIVATTAILADELGWSPEKAAAEAHAFRALLARDHGLTAGTLAERDRNTTRSLECA
jgi:glycerol-3-phosphate dehydrogenase